MALQSAADALIATSFDGYVSVSPIYEGAETYVFRARQTDTGIAVILKQTKNEYPSARELARLRREFMILREIALDNTPHALALEDHQRGLCLVMADIEQPTLREILERGKLELETALVLAIEIANVLAAIHAKRVIHKDLSPRNVLVDLERKKVFLIDFGISARLSHELSASVAVRSLEGTPYYVAPEQTGRMNRAVDARSDLYSLGVILYEMLVGHVPFQGREIQDVVQGHLVHTAIPPHEAVASIPEVLSTIVMKLLAKTPEERYQSDVGLAYDLGECLRRWRSTGTIEVFPLCTKDRAPELRRAQRLYGRERDLVTLGQAFARAREHGPELVLVSGYSGIGKSALVREMHKTISKYGGYFVSGKFEQLARDVPFAPVFSALRDLMREILAESPHAVSQWKEKLLRALKGNGALLTELVPELVFLLGEQPAVPEVTPDQAKNRFELTLLDFLHVFAAKNHPLVLFLDDLQWLDPASRKLLHLLLTDAFSEHLLIIGAYRDNEVEGGHPLLSLLAEIEESGFRPTRIQLEPLDRDMVAHLVADTLTSQPAEIRELADLCYEKTQGNPFFAHQFLVTLSKHDLLRFDAAQGAWTWDITTIRASNVTDNVVDLVIDLLKRLPESTQHILLLAACIGHTFDFTSLVLIAEKNPREVAAALFEAMKAGAIASLDGDYRYLEVELAAHAGNVTAESFHVRYRFVHDRVHEAAYLLLPEERRQKLHLTIGRLLGRHAKDDQLLDLVHHLNIGAPCMEDHAEQLDLARKNLRAAQRAMASTAYHAAAAYTRAGITLLREDDWDENYELCRSMYMVAGKCAYLAGAPERTAELFAELMRRVRTNIERAEIHREQVYSLASHGKFHEAVKVVLDALAELGHPLTMEQILSPQVLMAEIAQIYANLNGREIAAVVDAPETKDPVIRAVLAILDSIGDGAHHLGPIAFSNLNLRAVNIALVHGNTELVVNPYVCVGYMLAAIRGSVVEGMEFCRLAEEINNKYPSAAQAARLVFVTASAAHMQHSMRRVAQLFAVARQRCVETGELHLLGVACFLGTMAHLFAGDQLEDLLDLAGKNLAIVRRTKIPRNNAAMTAARQAVACLAGKTVSATSFSDANFDETKFVAELLAGQPSSTNVHYGVLKSFVLLIHGQYDEAWKALDIAARAVMFGGGTIQPKLVPFLRALLILLLPEATEPEEVAQRAQLLSKSHEEVKQLAGFSPKSFGHLAALLDAQLACTRGDVGQTVQHFERAIAAAIENKAPHIEAIGNELFAKYLISIGMSTGASAYMKNAYRAYTHWGAAPKAAALEAESITIWPTFRDISASRSSSSKTASEMGITLLGSTHVGSLKDAGVVVRAAQTIASEIDLAKVVDKLSKLVLENAGADRGALFLLRDGQFVMVARFGANDSAVDVAGAIVLDEASGCARSMVRYTGRTQESVVIDDADKTQRFSDDPHIKREKPRSVLSLPLLYQGKLTGVLYLENRSAAAVFNEARVELLALLSSQAAIAIEISRLIEKARLASEEIARANERLEAEVLRRTEELRDVNHNLAATNARLEGELELRRTAEEQRERLQEQVILGQRARLNEMSTPLLPITRDVMVMPLIGTMDSERAEQVLSVALEGAQRMGARVVILDVTGMKDVDTHVARMLVDVASALRLLGTQTLLTGIAPRIAQTLIAIGVDLGAFVTMSTLQSGVEYALKSVRGTALGVRARR